MGLCWEFKIQLASPICSGVRLTAPLQIRNNGACDTWRQIPQNNVVLAQASWGLRGSVKCANHLNCTDLDSA